MTVKFPVAPVLINLNTFIIDAIHLFLFARSIICTQFGVDDTMIIRKPDKANIIYALS